MKVISCLFMCCLLPGVACAASAKPRCLLVSSYHSGYAWSDREEAGARTTLGDACELRVFHMDTKRHKEEAFKKEAARRARDLIESWKPDVVITADDNAAKYLIVPYYKDKKQPFVFCGVNWTAASYGFPASNVTGMVEVAPIRALLKAAREISGGDRALYLGADTLSEKKNLKWVRRAAKARGILLDSRLVSNTDDWRKAFRKAQQDYDFLVIGSHAGIKGWDDRKMAAMALAEGRKLSVTVHDWMMPVTMLGMTKIPEEQGRWAASVAKEILKGHAPSEYPVLKNRQWELWKNPRLLGKAGITLSSRLERKAKKVNRVE